MDRGRARRCYRAPFSNPKGLLRSTCSDEVDNRNWDQEPAKEGLLKRGSREGADMHYSQNQDLSLEGSHQGQETTP